MVRIVPVTYHSEGQDIRQFQVLDDREQHIRGKAEERGMICLARVHFPCAWGLEVRWVFV